MTNERDSFCFLFVEMFVYGGDLHALLRVSRRGTHSLVLCYASRFVPLGCFVGSLQVGHTQSLDKIVIP